MGATMQLSGELQELKQTIRNIENFDYKGLNAAIGEAIRTSTVLRFNKEKDPENQSWTKSIRATKEGGQTLSETATLKNSITQRKSIHATKKGVEVGTNVIYAAVHNFGHDFGEITIRAKNKKVLRFKIGDKWISKKEVKIKLVMPKRQFLGINDDDQEEIKAMMIESMEDCIQK